MRIKRLASYRAFIAAGRPYLPIQRGNTLIVPHFSVNADKAANHHKKVLICQAITVCNSGNFTALYYEWFSRYGLRWRWLYFSHGKRVTFARLTWDEKRRVCLSYSRIDVFAHPGFMLKAPVKNWPEWADTAVRY